MSQTAIGSIRITGVDKRYIKSATLSFYCLKRQSLAYNNYKISTSCFSHLTTKMNKAVNLTNSISSAYSFSLRQTDKPL